MNGLRLEAERNTILKNNNPIVMSVRIVDLEIDNEGFSIIKKLLTLWKIGDLPNMENKMASINMK
jgi:hypothetical protein